MPENERPLSDEQKTTIEDKIKRAIDRDIPEAYVSRSDGSIEGGWLPYDLTIDTDKANGEPGEEIVHLAKVADNAEDTFTLKAMYKVDFDRVQAEAADVAEAADESRDMTKAERIRAIRMARVYRNQQQRLHGTTS